MWTAQMHPSLLGFFLDEGRTKHVCMDLLAPQAGRTWLGWWSSHHKTQGSEADLLSGSEGN